jgi:tRNA (guanine37-N1)-methyltransferase
VRFDIVTIFPDFFTGPLDYGIVRRAREANLIQIEILDLRKFTHDKHQTVDDRPFGGGEGMVLKAEPLFDAVESLVGPQPNPAAHRDSGTAIVLLSAAGKLFDQAAARRLAQCERVILLCGRYEGVDERVAEHLATDELSIGNFVLSGGELAAALVLDTVVRLLPGALGNEDSALNESFSEQATDSAGALAAGSIARGLLVEGPHYTRPENFRGWKVPPVLMSGNHQEIAKWRQQQSLEKTKQNRPELLSK